MEVVSSVVYKPVFCTKKYSSETQVSDRERRHCFSHRKNSQKIAPNLPIYIEPQGILSTSEGGTLNYFGHQGGTCFPSQLLEKLGNLQVPPKASWLITKMRLYLLPFTINSSHSWIGINCPVPCFGWKTHGPMDTFNIPEILKY